MEDICEDNEHDLNEFFNIAPGYVMIGCTKCLYWEPYENTEEVIIEYI